MPARQVAVSRLADTAAVGRPTLSGPKRRSPAACVLAAALFVQFLLRGG